MSDEEDYEYFTLISGVQGTYEVTSRDGDKVYNFKPGKVVKVEPYDAPKVRTYSYTKEVDETGLALPEDPSKGPGEAVITQKDITGQGENVTPDDEDKETPEEVPEPPEEEQEKIEKDPSVIYVDEAENIIEAEDNEIDLDDMGRPDIIKLATKLDYYKAKDENPATAKTDDLKEFIRNNI